jgi:tRNA-dihydrouridine synthase B
MPLLKQIKLGNIEINPPIMLAPMAGVTDAPFRKLVESFGGVGLMFSEMIASRAILQKTNKSLKKVEKEIKTTPLAIQIAGKDPKYMAEAAKLNEDLGAKIIDINFGCPVKKVVKGFAGSAIMKDEKLAQAIIKAVVNAVKVPVTVKMRMGWDMQNLNAPTIAKIAEDEGAQMVTVHGRTRSQMYTGKANWKFISTVKDAVKIPVIANGDIFTPQDAKECLKQSNADGIMIARGIYGKPWLISQINAFLTTGEIPNPPSKSEQKEIILAHFNDIIEHYGEQIGANPAKKHIGWYSAGMNNSGEFRNKINRMTNPQNIREEIEMFWG